VAFNPGPMKSYLADLDTGIAARVAMEGEPGRCCSTRMKQLTLDLSTTSFSAPNRTRGGRHHPRLRRHGRRLPSP
jgi:hypothetical protein